MIADHLAPTLRLTAAILAVAAVGAAVLAAAVRARRLPRPTGTDVGDLLIAARNAQPPGWAHIEIGVDEPTLGRLEIRWEPIEVTRGGVIPGGPPPDPIRRFAAGPPSYFLDGKPITEDEANDFLARHQGRVL